MEQSITYYVDKLKTSMMNRLVDEGAASLKDCYEQLLLELQSSSINIEEKERTIATLTTAYEHVHHELHEPEQLDYQHSSM